jgi:hypothetical protein
VNATSICPRSSCQPRPCGSLIRGDAHGPASCPPTQLSDKSACRSGRLRGLWVRGAPRPFQPGMRAGHTAPALRVPYLTTATENRRSLRLVRTCSPRVTRCQRKALEPIPKLMVRTVQACCPSVRVVSVLGQVRCKKS